MSTINPNIDPLTGRQRLTPAETMLDEAATQQTVGQRMQSAAAMSQDPTAANYNPNAAAQTLDEAIASAQEDRRAQQERLLRESMGDFGRAVEPGYRPGGTTDGVDFDAWMESVDAQRTPGIQYDTQQIERDPRGLLQPVQAASRRSGWNSIPGIPGVA